MGSLRGRRWGVAPVLAALMLAACTAPPKEVVPELTFSYLPLLRFDAARVEYVDAYRPPLRAPNVEHEFLLTPAAAAARWTKDRIRAVGPSGVVKVTLRDAHVIETSLKTDQGLTGALTTEQSQRYDGRLEMEIELFDGAGVKRAFVSAVATRTRTVPEDITLEKRDQVFFEITEALMHGINAELERQIDLHMAAFKR